MKRLLMVFQCAVIFQLIAMAGFTQTSVTIGNSREQVIAIIGIPQGSMKLGNWESLLFERGIVELTENKVTKVDLRTQSQISEEKLLSEIRRLSIPQTTTVTPQSKIYDSGYNLINKNDETRTFSTKPTSQPKTPIFDYTKYTIKSDGVGGYRLTDNNGNIFRIRMDHMGRYTISDENGNTIRIKPDYLERFREINENNSFSNNEPNIQLISPQSSNNSIIDQQSNSTNNITNGNFPYSLAYPNKEDNFSKFSKAVIFQAITNSMKRERSGCFCEFSEI